MKVTYDPEVDVLRIVFRDVPIEESDEDKPGVILDYDKEGNIVGLEVLNASQRVENPRGWVDLRSHELRPPRIGDIKYRMGRDMEGGGNRNLRRNPARMPRRLRSGSATLPFPLHRATQDTIKPRIGASS